MHGVGQRKQGAIARLRSDQGDAERQSVAAEAGRYGHSREVEQIYEVRIVAECRVEEDRIGADCGNGIDGSGGWSHDKVDLRPRRFAGALSAFSRYSPSKASTAEGF